MKPVCARKLGLAGKGVMYFISFILSAVINVLQLRFIYFLIKNNYLSHNYLLFMGMLKLMHICD